MEKDGTWCFSKRHGVQAFCYSTTETLNVTICSLFDFAEGLKDGGMENKLIDHFSLAECSPQRPEPHKISFVCSVVLTWALPQGCQVRCKFILCIGFRQLSSFKTERLSFSNLTIVHFHEDGHADLTHALQKFDAEMVFSRYNNYN